MLSRVVKPDTTTYTADYTRKNVRKEIGKNMSTMVTTGTRYVDTPPSLYETDFTRTAERAVYTRPMSAKMELLQLPPEYASTVKPKLERATEITDYQHYFGIPGEMATTKQSAFKSRTLSKTTRADVNGTTRCTHHPPGYDGHIPYEWKGNRGKYVHETRTNDEITWQYHNQKIGYSGYVPKVDMLTVERGPLKRTPTTYRDMCDELGYTIVD